MPTPASFKDFPVLPVFYPDHQQPRMEVPSFRTERSRIVDGPVSSVLLQCIVMHWAWTGLGLFLEVESMTALSFSS
jgi:hypothetical protein